MRLRTSLLIVVFVTSGCTRHVVRGNPLTLPTLERGKGAITHLDDEREAQQSGNVTISSKGWVLIIFDKPFGAPAKCNVRDLTARGGELELKMSEPDGFVLKGKAGHRIHFACMGQEVR